jgi:hypothetical protein
VWLSVAIEWVSGALAEIALHLRTEPTPRPAADQMPAMISSQSMVVGCCRSKPEGLAFSKGVTASLPPHEVLLEGISSVCIRLCVHVFMQVCR